MELTIKTANYILTVAQEKNITHAAQKLYISQPTLSLAIQKAEQQLGEKIFIRNGSELTLTRIGVKVVDACLRLVKLSRDLENEIDDELRSYSGQVVVGMPYNLGVSFFPQLLSIYQQEYPNVKMIPIEANSLECEKRLLAGSIDVALIPLPLPIESRQLKTRHLIHEHLVLTTKKGHPIREKAVNRGKRYPYLDLAELKDETFVLGPPEQRARILADQLFKIAKFEPKIAYICKNIDGQRTMAAAGLGFAISPEHYQDFYPLSKEIDQYYMLPPYDIPWEIVMVYRADGYLSVPAKECCKILSQFVHNAMNSST